MHLKKSKREKAMESDNRKKTGWCKFHEDKSGFVLVPWYREIDANRRQHRVGYLGGEAKWVWFE